MHSLAVLVAIIFLTMLLAGPIAVALTFIRIQKPVLKVIRRIAVCLLSAVGIFLGVVLLLEGVATGAKLFSLAAIAVAAYALKREFLRK
ncbi:unannotated protein [freshwater metagenome]|uniref:Unannotated protein n=1 Tax=freshwater metagenome TaxID=449393 RepID=A0A6J6ZXK8_9ZZZZ|nr:hypothetical protein [Actinomycetota bacterium]